VLSHPDQAAVASAAVVQAGAPLNLLGKLSKLFGSKTSDDKKEEKPQETKTPEPSASNAQKEESSAPVPKDDASASEASSATTAPASSQPAQAAAADSTPAPQTESPQPQHPATPVAPASDFLNPRPAYSWYVEDTKSATTAPLSDYVFSGPLTRGAEFPARATAAELDTLRRERDALIQRTYNATLRMSELVAILRTKQLQAPQFFAQDRQRLQGDLMVNRSVYRRAKVRALKALQMVSRKTHKMLFLLNLLTQSALKHSSIEGLATASAADVAKQTQWMRNERNKAFLALHKATELISKIIEVMQESQENADMSRMQTIANIKTGKDANLPRGPEVERIAIVEQHRARASSLQTERLLHKIRWLSQQINQQVFISHIQALRLKRNAERLTTATASGQNRNTMDNDVQARLLAAQIELLKVQQDRDRAMREVARATSMMQQLVSQLTDHKQKEQTLEAILQRTINARDATVGTPLAQDMPTTPPALKTTVSGLSTNGSTNTTTVSTKHSVHHNRPSSSSPLSSLPSQSSLTKQLNEITSILDKESQSNSERSQQNVTAASNPNNTAKRFAAVSEQTQAGPAVKSQSSGTLQPGAEPDLLSNAAKSTSSPASSTPTAAEFDKTHTSVPFTYGTFVPEYDGDNDNDS
jgi:hypothetical protein